MWCSMFRFTGCGFRELINIILSKHWGGSTVETPVPVVVLDYIRRRVILVSLGATVFYCHGKVVGEPR